LFAFALHVDQIFNCLSLCQGLTTEINYVDEATGPSLDGFKSISTLEYFRDLVEEACVENDDYQDENSCEDDSHQNESIDRVLIASYSRHVLNQTGQGHFSPIAAYDRESDSVLIMDTVSDHWLTVKMKLLSFNLAI
jgi:Phytochelatin synthase